MDRNHYLNTVFSLGLLTTPAWAEVIHAVSATASVISSICGAVIGITMVVRLILKKGN